MGIGGMSLGSLLIVLVIVMLLFGTKRLRGIGSDLGGALSGFRRAVKEGENARETLTSEMAQHDADYSETKRERIASGL